MRIVINADDFGMNRSCTAAILTAFESGLITTTTAMCNMEFFREAVAQIMDTPYKDRVGIHFVLTQGQPLTEGIRNDPFFCNRDGMFHGKIKRVWSFGTERKQMVYEELHKQAETFAASGLVFHHADSHHHVHLMPAITPIVRHVMKEFRIEKLRIHGNVGRTAVVKRTIRAVECNVGLRVAGLAYSDLFCGYNAADVALSSGFGKVLEIMCHPDRSGAGILIDRRGWTPDGTPFGDDLEACFASLGELRKIDGSFVKE